MILTGEKCLDELMDRNAGNRGGGALDLVMHLQGLTFMQAVRFVSKHERQCSKRWVLVPAVHRVGTDFLQKRAQQSTSGKRAISFMKNHTNAAQQTS